MTDLVKITEIFLYPVKSTAAIAVNEASVEPRGLAGDRRWVVTDDSGEFLTGREFPMLVKILAEPLADRLQMNAPGMPTIAAPIPYSGAPRQAVTVWNDRCKGLPAGDEVDDWLSEFLGLRCHLVYMDAKCIRTLDHALGLGEVSFADNSPLLLISGASLDDLNRRLPTPMDMRRFRPNLVVGGTGAYAEDAWQRIKVGEAVFQAVDRCDRCAFTTIDPDSAEKHPQQEPLRTLSHYRRDADGGVYFGRNLVAERLGRVRVGDLVTVLA